MTLGLCLTLSAALFCIGLYGMLTHRHAIGLLLSLELMANATNINLVSFSRFRGDGIGQVFALFSIALTVTEVVVGLAIVILVHRAYRDAQVSRASEFKE